MKDVVVAKLCSQCEELFGDALKHLQRETLKGLWDRDWIPRVAGKQAGYHALAEYHQSRVSVGFDFTAARHGFDIFDPQYCRKLFSCYRI